MKIFKHNKNKGFTLVECVVAIAAFAILTTMVIMIMMTSVKTQKKAGEAEEDLNTLVQNVVQDETNKKWGDDTKTLYMKIGTSGKDFSMTYSTVDGYKNFVVCPVCHEKYNNLEYMVQAYSSSAYASATDTEKAAYKACYWFDPATMHYQCPSCSTTFVDTLECLACTHTGAASTFIIDHFSGSYYCPVCGSANVRQEGLEDAVTSDSEFMISGMSANAIRYGTLTQPELEFAEKYMTFTVEGGGEKTFRATLKYVPNSKISLPGKYTLTIDNYSLAPDEFGKLSVTLPPCYVCRVTKQSNSCNGLSDHASVGINPSSKIEDYTQTSTLYVDNITWSGTGASFWVEFTLTNYETNNSFDYDYVDFFPTRTINKLMDFWFRKTSETVVYTP